jgi:hypothetical protein
VTALEVIDQIKTLSPAERARVRDFVHQMDTQDQPAVPVADDQRFAEAADWTFREHTELMRKLSQ